MDKADLEGEISGIELALSNELESLLLEHSNRVMSAVREAEQKLVPLRAYLAALDNGLPTDPPKNESALALLLKTLLAAHGGVHRSDLDAKVIAGGLTIASARKARYLAETQGLAIHVGPTWTLTAAGRMQAGDGR